MSSSQTRGRARTWVVVCAVVVSCLAVLLITFAGLMFVASLLALDPEDRVRPSLYIAPAVASLACCVGVTVLLARGPRK